MQLDGSVTLLPGWGRGNGWVVRDVGRWVRLVGGGGVAGSAPGIAFCAPIEAQDAKKGADVGNAAKRH